MFGTGHVRFLALHELPIDEQEGGLLGQRGRRENFFSTVKTELVGDSIPRSFDAASAAMDKYIEVFYNARRRHSSIGYVSPIEYELKIQIESVAA